MNRKQVNVRLSDEEFEELERLAKLHNKSKSEIVRTAFQGELAKIDSTKNKSLSDEERKDILVKIGSMMTYLSKVERQTDGVGRNINQIAKIANAGELGENKSADRYLEQADKFVEYSKNVKSEMASMSEELNRIWHTLV